MVEVSQQNKKFYKISLRVCSSKELDGYILLSKNITIDIVSHNLSISITSLFPLFSYYFANFVGIFQKISYNYV